MELSKKVLERELAGAKAALQAHQEGAEIHKIVVGCMEKRLKEFPKDKK